jgi:hypothetical protein
LQILQWHCFQHSPNDFFMIFPRSVVPRGIAIEWLATLPAALGDLDKITRIVKLLVLVNSAPYYTEPHVVANGASELFLEIFGERGAHARSAFGVAQIPFGSCVEIEMVVETFRSDSLRAVCSAHSANWLNKPNDRADV